ALEEALKLHQQTLALYEQAGNKMETAYAHGNLANISLLQGSYEQAHSHAQAALVYARQLDASHTLGYSLRVLAYIECEMGFFESAQLHFEEALELSRALHDKSNRVIALDGLARLALAQGRDETESQALFEE